MTARVAVPRKRFWRYHGALFGSGAPSRASGSVVLPSRRAASGASLPRVTPRSTAISRLRAQKVMDVIVIGGGIAGIATACQLHAAGHRVCVIERHATVAQGATYG